MAAAGNIYTIPPGVSFLRALARAVLAGDLPRAGSAPPAALDLPEITILLPTRRAARALQEAFLEESGARALLLPKIRPIAETNEDQGLLAALLNPETIGPAGEDIPPAVGEIERRLVLTGLVQRWSEAMRADAGDDPRGGAPFSASGATSAAQAAALAAELARLMDEVETENVSLSHIADLVPDSFSAHWQLTLRFLEIVLAWWPEHLKERALLSPMDRRNRLVLAEARHLAAMPPKGTLIVAGVTGSIPATAELMRAVARLDNGAIVLPALDQELDADSWQAIALPPPAPSHPEHPQFGLKRLLEALAVPRELGARPARRSSGRTRTPAPQVRQRSAAPRRRHRPLA